MDTDSLRSRFEHAVLDEQYRVDAYVASGGFGLVFKGYDLELEREVAIKFFVTTELSPAQDVHFRQKFDEEIRALSELDRHPNIVRILARGTFKPEQAPATPWMALEWLEGPVLSAHLGRPPREPLSPTAALELMNPVLEAIALAHEHRFVHCDLSPKNLMFADFGGTRQLKVIDFGIAKLLEPASARGPRKITDESNRALTVSHAAPEQLSVQSTDARTDVYSLGVIFTELLTGRDAFDLRERQKRAERSWNAAQSSLPTPKKFGVDAGPWERVLAKAVAPAPSQRYRNAGELQVALATALGAGTPGTTSDSTQSESLRPTIAPIRPRPQPPAKESAIREEPAPTRVAEPPAPLANPTAFRLALATIVALLVVLAIALVKLSQRG
jgi:serine/threonine protein kinase